MLSSELLRGIAPSPTSKTYHSPPAQINLHHGLKILAFSKRNSFVCQSADICVMYSWIPTGSDRYLCSLFLFFFCLVLEFLGFCSQSFNLKFWMFNLSLLKIKIKIVNGHVMSLIIKWVICVWISLMLYHLGELMPTTLSLFTTNDWRLMSIFVCFSGIPVNFFCRWYKFLRKSGAF